MSEPTRDDFVAECLARPDDMTARVVFADWLEEQGESDNDEVNAWRWWGSDHVRPEDSSRVARLMGCSPEQVYNSTFTMTADQFFSLSSDDRMEALNRASAMPWCFLYRRVGDTDERRSYPSDLGRVVLAAWELERAKQPEAAQ